MTKSKSLFKLIITVVICLYFTPSAGVDATCIEGNCTNGEGTFTWGNGEKYVGEYKDNKRHGQGTYTAPNGKVDRGIWQNDNLLNVVE